MVPVMSNSLLRGNEMPNNIDPWLQTREDRLREQRLNYLKSLQAHIPVRCPHCRTHLITDEEQIYCPRCGLVTQDSYPYVAGEHFKLPHGLRLG